MDGRSLRTGQHAQRAVVEERRLGPERAPTLPLVTVEQIVLVKTRKHKIVISIPAQVLYKIYHQKRDCKNNPFDKIIFCWHA